MDVDIPREKAHRRWGEFYEAALMHAGESVLAGMPIFHERNCRAEIR
jgi:hypothetical protein